MTSLSIAGSVKIIDVVQLEQEIMELLDYRVMIEGSEFAAIKR
jgi:hypothetical protein